MIKQYLQKKIFKTEVVSDLPGRLRLKLVHYKTFPKEAIEYIAYIEEAILIFKGIESVQFNTAIGSILITYQPKETCKNDILKWIDIIIQTGINNAKLIEQYGQSDRIYLKKAIEEKLKNQLQERW